MKSSIFAAAVVLFALSACTGSVQKYSQFEKGVLEPKVDIAYDVVITRLCDLPLDIQLRAMRRGTVTIDALLIMCSDWKEARDAMLGSAFNGLGIDYKGTRINPQ